MLNMQVFTSGTGRISRQTWWLASIVLAVIYFVVEIVVGVIAGLGRESGAVVIVQLLNLVVVIAYAAFSIMIGVKRLHDVDKSGWFYLISLIPLVGGLIIFIYCGFIKGTVGPNKYGDDPTLPQELNDQFRTGESIPAPAQSGTNIWLIVAVVVGVFICIPVLVITVLTLMGPAISNIFSTINMKL